MQWSCCKSAVLPARPVAVTQAGRFLPQYKILQKSFSLRRRPHAAAEAAGRHLLMLLVVFHLQVRVECNGNTRRRQCLAQTPNPQLRPYHQNYRTNRNPCSCRGSLPTRNRTSQGVEHTAGQSLESRAAQEEIVIHNDTAGDLLLLSSVRPVTVRKTSSRAAGDKQRE